MSNKANFCVNNNGHVIWNQTGERVHEQEFQTMDKALKDEYGIAATQALRGPVDVDKAYRPW